MALALAGAGLVVWLKPASAGTASKKDFYYQDKPKDGHRCADCGSYQPPAAGTGDAACRIVAGTVSPDGWCLAFSAKAS